MPVLQSEPAVLPEDLFGRLDEVAGDDRRWYTMHTKPRQEKSLARSLYQAAIPFYLPLVARRLSMRGRVVTSYPPLFDGYVFVLAGREERIAALSTGRIVRALDVPNQSQLGIDLQGLSQLIASGAPITPQDRLSSGMRVIIRSGPLSGLEGTILREASRRRFVVQVNFLQKGASALLEDCVLTECV